MTVYDFMGAHPILTIVLAYLFFEGGVGYPCKMLNRFFRSRNVKNAGWPPPHLDADGDWKSDARP